MRYVVISFLVAGFFLGGIIVLLKAGGPKDTVGSAGNVSMVDGKQIIQIDAKGGYLPRITTARANIPSVIKVNTNGTFDCSSAIVIPRLGYRNNLPPSGETLIEVPPQQEGASVQGLCAMGMYNFTVNFN